MTSEDRRTRLAAAGRWLRVAREGRGFAKAVDFARALGVDASLISQYERGMTAVPDDRADQIAEALRLDVITVRRNLGLWVPDDQATEPETDADPLAGLPDDPDERLRALSDRLQRVTQAIAEEMDHLARLRRAADEDRPHSA